MRFSLFRKAAKPDGPQAFWAWFERNEARLYNFESDQDRVFYELAAQMKTIDRDLTFEFGPNRPDGKREFIMSAGGVKSGFPAVEALYGAAPPLGRWIWVKFKPRTDRLHDVVFGGTKVRAADVRYLIYKEGDRICLALVFNGYRDDQRDTFDQIGFLMLDQALGEYDVATRVGTIDFQPTALIHDPGLRPLRELRADFDERWRSRVK